MGVTKKDIEIEIMPDGTVSLAVKGAKGKECLDLTKFLEEALGEVTERTHTSEYYEQETKTDGTIKVGGD